jgi:hypothetical protein
MGKIYFIRKNHEDILKENRQILEEMKQVQTTTPRVIERVIEKTVVTSSAPPVEVAPQAPFVPAEEEAVFIPRSDLNANVNLAVETTTEDAGDAKKSAGKLRNKIKKAAKDPAPDGE